MRRSAFYFIAATAIAVFSLTTSENPRVLIALGVSVSIGIVLMGAVNRIMTWLEDHHD